MGVDVLDDALGRIRDLTKGYPYFVQEWGYQLWNHATHSPIGESDVVVIDASATRRLDENCFRVRMNRLTEGERSFLRAMARVENEPIQIAVVAEALGVSVSSLSPRRGALIRKGMVYSPAHGEIAYTVPLFGEFLRRSGA